METMVLEFLGLDDWENAVYKNEEGKFFKDISGDGESDLYTCGSFDGCPITSIRNIEKYKGMEIKVVGMENEPTTEEKYSYMLLGRLKSDCDYYLGYGNKNANRLWAGNEQDQIDEMKKLWNGFTDDKKPEWLTWEQILAYERIMVRKQVDLQFTNHNELQQPVITKNTAESPSF